MADVIGGLFGLNPYQVQQQQYAQDEARAAQMAQMGAAQRGVQGLMMGGAGLARLGAGMMGMQNPEVESVKARQQMLSESGLNLDDPDSLRQTAAKMRQTDPQVAMRLMQLANQRESELVEANRKQVMNIKDIALAEKALRENPNSVITDVGVEGKPGWMQKASVDKQTGKIIERIGDPYMGAALSKQNFYVGGGNEKPTYIQDEQGNVNVFQGGRLVNTIGGAGKPSASFGKARQESEESLVSLKGDLGTLDAKIQAVKKHPGLPRATGAMALAPSVPGSAASRVEGLIDEVKNTLKMMGLNMARQGGGIGAMTEKEWPIVEGMVANLDRTKGEEYVREQLDKVLSEAKRIYNQADEINRKIYARQPAPTATVGGWAIREKK